MKLYNRVKQETTTTGTGDYSFTGSLSGFRTFAAAVLVSGNIPYCATDGTDYEIGIGYFSTGAGTLGRATILESTNAGSAVSWAAGTKTAFIVEPAQLANSAMCHVNRSTAQSIASGNLDITFNTLVYEDISGTGLTGGGNTISMPSQFNKGELTVTAYITSAAATDITCGLVQSGGDWIARVVSGAKTTHHISLYSGPFYDDLYLAYIVNVATTGACTIQSIDFKARFFN